MASLGKLMILSYTFSTIKCTHVVTAMPLNGSKNHQYLTAKTSRIKIVTPEWVSQSVEAGKRLNEARFRVVQDETQKSVVEFMFNKSQSAARNI
ncbi:hypothetical protein G9A89_022920 [Geosiphon pyriformis]|nr:hypothetical protein G9A89_022920 [Geosiphon pyriformis]